MGQDDNATADNAVSAATQARIDKVDARRERETSKSSDTLEALRSEKTHLRQELSAAQKQIADMSMHLHATKKVAQDLRKALKAKRAELKSLHDSRSWRITAPLRVLGDTVRFLKRKYASAASFRSVKFLENQHLSPQKPTKRSERRSERKILPTSTRKLENKLWSGFSRSALEEFNALLSDSSRAAKDRAEAAFVLARWKAFHGEFSDAANEAQRARQLDPERASNPRQRIVEALFLCHAGRQEEARAMLTAAPARFDTPTELMLANTWNPRLPALQRTSSAAEGEARILAHINSVFRHFGVRTIEKRDEQRPLSIDNIRGTLSAGHRAANNTLVSVLVPAYNAQAKITTALQSLAEQTWENLEVLVIDDASTDDTADVVSAFCASDERFRLIRQTKNSGGYSCRNRGLQEAKGEFVTVHDADDWSHPDKISYQIEPLLDQKMPYSFSMWVRATTNLIFGDPTRYGPDLLGLNHSSGLFRTAHVRNLGGWDNARVAADTEFIWRMERVLGNNKDKIRERAVLATCPLAIGRVAHGSLTHTSATHIVTNKHGLRREYLEAAAHWHEQHITAMDLDSESLDISPPFFRAPGRIRTRDSARESVDFLFIGDFNAQGDAHRSAKELILEANGPNSSCALLHYPAYDRDVTKPLNSATRSFADVHDVRIVTAGEKLTARNVVVVHPFVLNHLMDRFPAVDSQRLVLLVDQMDGTDALGYNMASNVERIQRNAVVLFGQEGDWVSSVNYPKYLLAFRQGSLPKDN